MRVLVVLAEPPDVEGGAAGRCSVALLQGLRAHGLDVQAVAAGREARTYEVGDVTVEVVPTAPQGGRLHRLRRPRSEFADGGLRDAVRRYDADVLHLDEIDTAWCDDGLPTPSLLHLHYRVGLDRPPTDRAWLEYALAERAAIKRHHLTASSERVAASFGKPSVLHRLSLMPYPRATLDEPVAGLIGTLDWPPTRAALDRLAVVWPRVGVGTLRVAGRGSGPRVGEFVGEVASAADFIGGLGVLLYPIPRGSGAKVKVLEAMACGVPVVTTRCGAEGVRPNDGVVVCEDDDALVNVTRELLRDKASRVERGEAARREFEASHAPLPATAPLVEAYGRLA